MTLRATMFGSLGLAASRLRHAPQHLVLDLVLQAVVILVVGHVIPGVLVDDVFVALLAAAAIGILNALVRPVLIVLTLPLSVASFGLVSLLINTAMVVLAAPLIPGMEVNGFLAAFALAIVLTVATTAVNVILAVDDHESFYAELARRVGRVDQVNVEPGNRGLVIIQIDGLAAPILANAIRVGLVPRLATWVRSGEYRLVEWECPPSSQTSASQAGLLLGDNAGIPAFRWYEKTSGRLLVSNRPADAAEIERRLGGGGGLLAQGGTSVGNLFSGGATRNAFVMSRMGNPLGDLDMDAFSLYFIDPAAFIRTVMLSITEFAKELVEARRQRNQDIQPRVHRGATFALLRAATNVVLRDLNTTFVVRSMALGTPVIFVDYVDYDEIAHHAGPERLESLRALTGLDRVVSSLERAARDAPREYRFVLLSDHGQSQGATFRQRYDITLEAFIRGIMGGDPTTVAATGRSETFGPVNALLTEIASRPGVTGRLTSRALRGQTVNQAVDLGADAETPGTGTGAPPELVVCASGNLAQVYFPKRPGRLTAETIEADHPGLLAALASHPGIGWVLVRSERGALVLGPSGVRYLDQDRVVGDDPLAPFGPRAADHLRRLDGFDNAGDLTINSLYDADLDEVAAFEELVGSHGGMGGPQNRPFLMAPNDLPVQSEQLVGASAVHRQLVTWTETLAVHRAAAVPAGHVELRRPRGLPWVAAYLALMGSLLLLTGALAMWALVVGSSLALEGAQAELIDHSGVIGVVLAVTGAVGVLTAWGIWRRRRWAWLAALAISAITVLQLVMALASGGFKGIVSYGLVGAAVSLGAFFYLTRPHVAAAFGRRSAAAKRQGLDA